MDALRRPTFITARTEWTRLLRPVTGNFRLRDERPREASAREALLDRAFGPERSARTCQRLRDGRLPAEGLSFVATIGAAVVGTLRFWHVEAGDRPALLLGPLAVEPASRSGGIGRALIEHGLNRARKLGHESVVLVGDAPYYARFGFSRPPVADLVLPGPVDVERFLGLELVAGSLQRARGRVVGAGLIVEGRSRPELRLAA